MQMHVYTLAYACVCVWCVRKSPFVWLYVRLSMCLFSVKKKRSIFSFPFIMELARPYGASTFALKACAFKGTLTICLRLQLNSSASLLHAS